jgi:hypothetical protein
LAFALTNISYYCVGQPIATYRKRDCIAICIDIITLVSAVLIGAGVLFGHHFGGISASMGVYYLSWGLVSAGIIGGLLDWAVACWKSKK